MPSTMRTKPGLIDDKGELWPEPSLELRRRLHCLDYPGDLATDVIRNLGFIGWQWKGDLLTLRLNERTMAAAAFVAATYLIRDLQPAGVLLGFQGNHRPEELVVDPDETIARLGAIHNAAETARRIRARHGDPSRLDARSPLAPIFDCWRNRRGVADGTELAHLAEQHIAGRYIVVGVKDSEFVVDDWGRGFQVPDPEWYARGKGQRITASGDPLYFRWVDRCYRDALASRRPDVADVDAEIRWREVGRRRSLYTRLLLPCVGRDGRQFLFSANAAYGAVSSALSQAS